MQCRFWVRSYNITNFEHWMKCLFCFLQHFNHWIYFKKKRKTIFLDIFFSTFYFKKINLIKFLNYQIRHNFEVTILRNVRNFFLLIIRWIHRKKLLYQIKWHGIFTQHFNSFQFAFWLNHNSTWICLKSFAFRIDFLHFSFSKIAKKNYIIAW